MPVFRFKLQATTASQQIHILEGEALTPSEMWRMYVVWAEKNKYYDVVKVELVE